MPWWDQESVISQQRPGRNPHCSRSLEALEAHVLPRLTSSLRPWMSGWAQPQHGGASTNSNASLRTESRPVLTKQGGTAAQPCGHVRLQGVMPQPFFLWS
jgi:hypothetical protein